MQTYVQLAALGSGRYGPGGCGPTGETGQVSVRSGRVWPLMAPDEIASAVVWLASPHAGMVNGQSLIVDGGGLVR